MLICMTEELHQSWGRRVQKRREALGLSQERLAALCGMRQSTISRIEAGSCPRDSTKWVLAGALQSTVEELFPYPAVRPPFPAQVAS